MMGHREVLTATEWDCFHRCMRRRYTMFGKPRITHGVKKDHARRVRRRAKQELRSGPR